MRGVNQRNEDVPKTQIVILANVTYVTCPPRSLAEMAAATSVHVVAIVEPIIQHADWFFPEGRLLVSSAAVPVSARPACLCSL